MTEDTNSVEQDVEADVLTVDDVMGKVRSFVATILNGGAKPPDISFGLAYVATELGLALADKSVQVFPVVLRAVTSAAVDHKAQAEETEANGTDVSNSLDSKLTSAVH